MIICIYSSPFTIQTLSLNPHTCTRWSSSFEAFQLSDFSCFCAFRDSFQRIYSVYILPETKQFCTWKMLVGRRSFPIGVVLLLVFRECNFPYIHTLQWGCNQSDTTDDPGFSCLIWFFQVMNLFIIKTRHHRVIKTSGALPHLQISSVSSSSLWSQITNQKYGWWKKSGDHHLGCM